MLTVILTFVLILVIAWAVYTYIPHPIGVVGGLLILICGLIYLVQNLQACSGATC